MGKVAAPPASTNPLSKICDAVPPPKAFYILEWEYVYDTPGDEVYFAQFHPYTYSDLLQDLKSAKERCVSSNILQVNTLCRTVAKNACPVLTITSNVNTYLPFCYESALSMKSVAARRLVWAKVDKFRSQLVRQRAAARFKKGRRKVRTKEDVTDLTDLSDSTATLEANKLYEFAEPLLAKEHNLECIHPSACPSVDSILRHQEDHGRKKAVVFTARVHPGTLFMPFLTPSIGEVPSSWVLRGLINFLLSDSPEAKLLRSQYVFRIIPMLNPDGVIYGNYRCSLLGFDLNRKWKSPSRHLQPTVFYTKQLLKFVSEERDIVLYCDFHAHSTQKNVFMYGCSHQPAEYDHIRKNAAIRVVPLLMSQQNNNFSYRSSRFRVEKSRESTARIVVFKEFGVTASYTCESTFFW